MIRFTSGSLFKVMLANPPYGKSWKVDAEKMGGKKEILDTRFNTYLEDGTEMKMIPRTSDGQLLFLLNNVAKMKKDSPLGSRIAEVHNGSSIFTGDAGSGESNARRYMIENDLVEAIIALPENMFYNTGIGTFIWVLSNKKEERRKGKIQLIDATDMKSPLRKNMGKVSNINKLINIKKKEIKDIDALKRSLISHAITHGLSADTPMKYSGVKWLGDIPAHWQIMKLRQILHSISVKNHPELPLLSVVREQGVILRDVEDTESNHNFIPDDLSGYKVVKKGQFAMNKMKAWQGSYGISDYTGIVSPAYFIFDVAFDNLEYFHYAIRSKVYVNFFAQASDGIRVGQWDLQMDKMKEIPFIIPPADEQNVIVEHIKNTLPTYNTGQLGSYKFGTAQ